MNVCSILFLVLFCLAPDAVADSVRVQGVVMTEQREPVTDAEVTLLHIQMREKPALTPIGQVRTDQEGRFEFVVETDADRVFYRVTAATRESAAGSEPFRLDGSTPVQIVELTLPRVLAGINHLDFKKQILVFESLAEALQVTEVIYFSNLSEGIVKIKDGSLQKPIPSRAYEFEFFSRQPRFRGRLENDSVVFDLSVPQGDHQLLFSYLLPAERRTVSIPVYLSPDVDELEIITPDSALQISFDEPGRRFFSEIVSRKKQINHRNYHSQTVFPNSGRERVMISISNIPLDQSRFIYPAMVFAALLILGFLIYTSRSGRVDLAAQD